MYSEEEEENYYLAVLISNRGDYGLLECGEKCRHGLWYHMHREMSVINNTKQQLQKHVKNYNGSVTK